MASRSWARRPGSTISSSPAVSPRVSPDAAAPGGHGGMDPPRRSRSRPLGLRYQTFGQHHLGRRYLNERSVESYGATTPSLSDRGGEKRLRRARIPLYPILAARRRLHRFGWERELVAPPGVAAATNTTFETAATGFPCRRRVGRAKRRALRSGSFSKFEIAGPTPSRRCNISPPTISTRRRARRPTRSYATSAAESKLISRSRGSPRTASTSSPAAASAFAIRTGSAPICRATAR